MLDTLYREEILEHYRNPQNFGKLSDFDISSKQSNPFCGDEIEIFVNFRDITQGANSIPPLRWKVKKVEDISFEGQGCVISMAGASMLTEFVKGKTKEKLTSFSENDMLNLLGIEVIGAKRLHLWR